VTGFDEFFQAATVTEERPEGFGPHGYQLRLAREGLPDAVHAPTGTSKTGIMELNGWSSPQMLRRYGASVAALEPAAATTASWRMRPNHLLFMDRFSHFHPLA
jgi:hypothetical protein